MITLRRLKEIISKIEKLNTEALDLDIAIRDSDTDESWSLTSIDLVDENHDLADVYDLGTVIFNFNDLE